MMTRYLLTGLGAGLLFINDFSNVHPIVKYEKDIAGKTGDQEPYDVQLTQTLSLAIF